MIKIYAFLFSLLLITSVVRAEGPLEKNGSIRGHVQTSDNKPADFVNVGLKNTSKGTITDENGNYLLTGVKPGTYTIKVSFVGLQTEEKQVTVTEGRQTVINFTIRENASQLDEVAITGANRLNRPVTVGKAGLRPLDVPQSIQVIDSTVIPISRSTACLT